MDPNHTRPANQGTFKTASTTSVETPQRDASRFLFYRMVHETASPLAKYALEPSPEPEAASVAEEDETPPTFVVDGTPMKIWISTGVPTRSTFVHLVEVSLGKRS